MMLPQQPQDFYPGRNTAWPLWMMRQAGRTLPEYQALRQKAHSFLDLVSSPDLIRDITLQPLRRFDCDAAIIFSDILLPLASLPGLTLSFQDKSRPCIQFDARPLEALEEAVSALPADSLLFCVPEACSLVKSSLTERQQLIGFCGGVWTVAAYLFGQSSPLDWGSILKKIDTISVEDQNRWIALLVTLLTKALLAQYHAGATQVMIFESWAGFAPPSLHQQWLKAPIQALIENFQRAAPGCPVIYYSQGLGSLPYQWQFPAPILACGRDFSIGDYQKNQEKSQCSSPYVFQGNCDPQWLFLSPKEIEAHVEKWFSSLAEPVIINLSSGLDPLTPVANIEHFVKTIRKYTQS